MNISANFNHLTQLINQAEQDSTRKLNGVLLLAVTKEQNSSMIRQAYALGMRDFGENYMQEAIPKIAQLNDLTITWHFIGPIQSNKAKKIAMTFDWVHSVDRLKIALLLNLYPFLDLTWSIFGNPLSLSLSLSLSL